jgi:hypothetical protein
VLILLFIRWQAVQAHRGGEGADPGHRRWRQPHDDELDVGEPTDKTGILLLTT